ncbi:MAG: hypothetical protein AMDU1_APLC00082G0039 [Thermoplasmatales archaeon A-plasma]|nr:MAG: hypothetical protein AMDU1_APLC00082G0039 [Thermoplasmatales archaeon A-plasma]
MLIIPKDSESSEVLGDLLQSSSASFRKIRLYDRDVILADHHAGIDTGSLGIALTDGLTSRKFKPTPTTVQVGDLRIGPDRLVIAAGPCAVESRDQISAIAEDVKRFGADIPEGWGIQAAYQSIFFPGSWNTGPETAEGSFR